MHHTINEVILFVLGGTAAFTLGWYLLGVGIGIAQRGYKPGSPLPHPHQSGWPTDDGVPPLHRPLERVGTHALTAPGD
jgi:hypothetical protein